MIGKKTNSGLSKGFIYVPYIINVTTCKTSNPCSEIPLKTLKSRYTTCTLGRDDEFEKKEVIRKNREKIIDKILNE